MLNARIFRGEGIDPIRCQCGKMGGLTVRPAYVEGIHNAVGSEAEVNLGRVGREVTAAGAPLRDLLPSSGGEGASRSHGIRPAGATGTLQGDPVMDRRAVVM